MCLLHPLVQHATGHRCRAYTRSGWYGCAVLPHTHPRCRARQVILFTSKQDAPPVFRALAGNLPHSFEFAYAVDSDKAIVEQFNVKRVPAMMVALIDPESKGVRLQPYPGLFRVDPRSTTCWCFLSTALRYPSSPPKCTSHS